jgi:uncharacterized protein YrrD
MHDNEIHKWSKLRGLPAVSIDTGTKAGTWEDFYFDPHTNNISELVIKTGMFGSHVLPVALIKAIGTDALTFANEEQLRKEGKFSLPKGSSLLTYRVLSEGGTLIGNIGNIRLSIVLPALTIVGFELAGGLSQKLTGHYQSFSAQQVARYGQDVLIVPDEVAKQLQS